MLSPVIPLLALVSLFLPSALGMAASANWNRAVLPVAGLAIELQSQPTSCGPALVATLASWQGRRVSEATVLGQADVGAAGISLAEFARLASLHGLDGAWYHVERSRLGSLPFPFVAHLAEAEGGHYVAVMALRDSVMVVVDPAVGALVGPADALLRRFSGRVFVLDGQS